MEVCSTVYFLNTIRGDVRSPMLSTMTSIAEFHSTPPSKLMNCQQTIGIIRPEAPGL
jgi:hypothetical protein